MLFPSFDFSGNRYSEIFSAGRGDINGGYTVFWNGEACIYREGQAADAGQAISLPARFETTKRTRITNQSIIEKT